MTAQQVEHQPRERAVPCSRCGGSTWAVTAICDRCAQREACPVCHDDPESVEAYSRGSSVATIPANCPACGARNRLARGGRR